MQLIISKNKEFTEEKQMDFWQGVLFMKVAESVLFNQRTANIEV